MSKMVINTWWGLLLRCHTSLVIFHCKDNLDHADTVCLSSMYALCVAALHIISLDTSIAGFVSDT